MHFQNIKMGLQMHFSEAGIRNHTFCLDLLGFACALKQRCVFLVGHASALSSKCYYSEEWKADCSLHVFLGVSNIWLKGFAQQYIYIYIYTVYYSVVSFLWASSWCRRTLPTLEAVPETHIVKRKYSFTSSERGRRDLLWISVTFLVAMRSKQWMFFSSWPMCSLCLVWGS